MNLWSFQNPRERLWASRTRQLQRAHVSIYDRLWSNLPYLRPLCTITGDSLKDYGKDKEGGRVHDLLGTRCDPFVNRALTGEDFDYCCHSNLTRAVAEFGLVEVSLVLEFGMSGLDKKSILMLSISLLSSLFSLNFDYSFYSSSRAMSTTF